MFGVRLRTLFTSRWFALLWAVLVILTAINYVGTGDDRPADAANGTAPDGLTNDQRAAIANAL
ncbi:hypothetical protein [Sphingobium amiense]|uniref:hypothetical protein n=1 Tax=Sphingobium amiense TaxID=135719 RepID=UPI000832D8B6|nr:hypothetical protein [Sphingobium amiense]